MVEFTAGMMAMGLSLTLLIGLFPKWFFKEHDRQLAERVWEEGFDAGEKDVMMHQTYDEPCIENPYRKVDTTPDTGYTEGNNETTEV